MLLAIDTSGGTSVAVLEDDGAVVGEWSSPDPRGHAEQIGPMLARAFAAADGRVTAVAYGVGPGPFTGLRVGMAAARAAARALGAAELPVPSHDAVALDALEDGVAAPFVVTADAKRRERFFTVYAEQDPAGVPGSATGPQVGREDALPSLPHVDRRVRAVRLGQVALRRRAAGVALPSGEARYLRSPDVTPAAAPRSVLG